MNSRYVCVDGNKQNIISGLNFLSCNEIITIHNTFIHRDVQLSFENCYLEIYLIRVVALGIWRRCNSRYEREIIP